LNSQGFCADGATPSASSGSEGLKVSRFLFDGFRINNKGMKMKKLVVLNRARAITFATVGWVALVMSLAATGAEKFEKFVATAQIVEVLDFNVDSSCQPASPGSESTAFGRISGSGLGTTGIGAFTLSSLDCVRAANPYFQPPYNFSSKSLKLTTSYGDDIVATYSGTAVLDPATFLLVLNGTFEFTGGTGKYKKVQGGGSLVGAEDISKFPTARGFVTLTGSIAR